MPDYLGDDQRKTKDKEDKEDAPIRGIFKNMFLMLFAEQEPQLLAV